MQLWKVRSFRNWGDEMSHSVLHNVIRSKRKTREPSKDKFIFKQQEQALSAERLANTSERKLYVQ
jgi:hypothetical protein